MNFTTVNNGVINEIIKFFGGKPIAFLQSKRYFRSVIVIAEIWKGAGWGTIIYLAALSGIDQELYEAAIVDGASRIQRILHITLPGISNTIAVLLIMRTGGILSNGFEQIYMLYSPLVYQVADVFETYSYRIGLAGGRFSYGTAIGLFTSLVGIILIFTTNHFSRKIGGRGMW
jgi:putative aldouronate transport system permease protein